MICGLEQLRIIGMLQLVLRLPFVISGIRNYELSTFVQVIFAWGKGLYRTWDQAWIGLNRPTPPPNSDLGLQGQGKEVIIYTLKLSYLKIAFSDCLLYHLSAGKVFALRSNLSSPRFSPCLHLKKKVSPQKFFSKKKYFRFFPSTFLQINKRVPYPPKFFLYFLKFGMLE